MDKCKVEWAVKNGSIFTKKTYPLKVSVGQVWVPIAIAYNVGQEVAEHIVRLHNGSLHEETLEQLLEAFDPEVHGGEAWPDAPITS